VNGFFRLAFLAMSLAALSASAANEEAIAKAKEAAQSWLALADSGNGAKSWQSAASLFKAGVPQDKWEQAFAATRAPLGALKGRTLSSATYSRTLPGAPDGEYVVIQYSSQFANKASAVETVTPMREKDGSWKVSGYYIK
jgi:Protein of unknown function (DUF4019)